MIKNITEKIVYVGVDDTDIDLFESQYLVPNGVSYNSYVILDEKVAVMDTVDRRKSDEWFQNLDVALAGRKPDYLVVQHLEPDHAGTIAMFLDEKKREWNKIVDRAMAADFSWNASAKKYQEMYDWLIG